MSLIPLDVSQQVLKPGTFGAREGHDKLGRQQIKSNPIVQAARETVYYLQRIPMQLDDYRRTMPLSWFGCQVLRTRSLEYGSHGLLHSLSQGRSVSSNFIRAQPHLIYHAQPTRHFWGRHLSSIKHYLTAGEILQQPLQYVWMARLSK